MLRAFSIPALTICALVLSTTAPEARTLTVGKGGLFALPSQAAQAAQAGDTIAIAPGTYTDCMDIDANNVTITGTGAGVILQNKTCENKGIITIDANNITVNGLTLQGATSTDLNGAGIRGLGDNLTVTNTKFINDQMGILATSPLANNSTIVVKNSTFSGNGSCGSFSGKCHSIYVGQIVKLDVENSTFTDEEFGHFIKSRALLSVIAGNTIEDGPTAQSSYLIDIPDGGNVTITNNTIEKGPLAINHCCAITIGEDLTIPLNPTSHILVQGNRFTNDNANQVIFVRNDTKAAAQLIANTLHGRVIPLTGPGSVTALLKRLADLPGIAGDPRLFLENVVAAGSGYAVLVGGSPNLSAFVDAGNVPARVSEPNGALILAGALALASLPLRRRASSAQLRDSSRRPTPRAHP